MLELIVNVTETLDRNFVLGLILKNFIYGIIWVYIYSKNVSVMSENVKFTIGLIILFCIPVNILHITPELVGIWANSLPWPFVANLILSNIYKKQMISSFFTRWEDELRIIIASPDVDEAEKSEARVKLSFVVSSFTSVRTALGLL